MALPVITSQQVRKHASRSSCWVTLNDRVYDVTAFLADHPGGADLILDYAGKDVTAIMKDVQEHEHSESAYEILYDNCVGVLNDTTEITESMQDNRHFEGERARLHQRRVQLLQQEEEFKTYTRPDFHPSVTDVNTDMKQHRFLDLRQALIPQIMRAKFTKEFYLEQVHKPRYLPTPAIFFGHPLLEPLTKTVWYMIPTIWLPYVGYQLYQSFTYHHPIATTLFFVFGIMIWTLLEYGLHRFLFHLDDLLPDHQLAFLLHFALHGFHHYLPMDRLRLVVPPALFVLLAYPWIKLAHLLFPPLMSHGVIAGGIFGYILYDLTHYYLHHAKVLDFHFKEMKKYHLAHHYKDFEAGYGITSKFWDNIFGTTLTYT
ncbi:uncharacterized protein BYT42DRAFT_573106 [Radiomyces spectabilis]|uniref:uncharacterized protein n=1 Tax=Radiomyces spectabilis TaxID=64574 RepID=UPI00221E95A2|nr:uncharacterized protein BYT42DRAFT_573106 [Radiomyces spectabilis]KAI8376015.1 hypothetical protein BYT42DRAFT_573106 [Radiomyces spectabilis]